MSQTTPPRTTTPDGQPTIGDVVQGLTDPKKRNVVPLLKFVIPSLLTLLVAFANQRTEHSKLKADTERSTAATYGANARVENSHADDLTKILERLGAVEKLQQSQALLLDASVKAHPRQRRAGVDQKLVDDARADAVKAVAVKKGAAVKVVARAPEAVPVAAPQPGESPPAPPPAAPGGGHP